MPPKKVPKGSHKMPDGSVMKDSDMPKKAASKKAAPKKAAPKKEAPKMNWKSHLADVYAAGKKKDSSYKYSQAMKDAKKTYKK